MSKDFPMGRRVPSLDDPKSTLIPRHEHPRRSFVPVIAVPNAYGKSVRRDVCGNRVNVVDTEAVTKRIVKLAPKEEECGAQYLFVMALAVTLIGIGILIGLRIQ